MYFFKIIPPKGWVPQSNYEQFSDSVIKEPIEQVVSGAAGLYRQTNVIQNSLTVRQFRELTFLKELVLFITSTF